jgi:hypothetical protein
MTRLGVRVREFSGRVRCFLAINFSSFHKC